MSKIELRQHYKAVLQSLSSERLRQASEKANRRLICMIHLAYQNMIPPSNRLVLSYMAMPQEVNLGDFNRYLASRSQLVLPRVSKEHNQLKLHLVTNLSELRPTPPYNILEPDPVLHPEVTIEKLGYAIIPGLAFDKWGNRLGRGKGYYDRLLTNIPDDFKAIAVAFEEQKSENDLPMEKHDVRLKMLALF